MAIFGAGVCAADVPPSMQTVLPGFIVRELPINLTSLNNIEYAPDGRLFAGGYDGRFHMLQDRDGDGLEETVTTLSEEKSPNYPLGVAVKDGSPYFVLTDEVIRFVDKDADGIPETRETVIKEFDDPKLKNLSYLHNRRVDSSMGLAIGPDGSIYVTMGNAGFSNPYWLDNVTVNKNGTEAGQGDPQYSTSKRRGCLLRIHPDGRVEQLASGLRYVMSLQFNGAGDLFASDQEGATWSPNGNPFDELLFLETGRHYGFPPSHPKYLSNVIDEPSVFDYAPQHQSTCGFRFNGPLPGRGRFGPEWWSHDVLMTGESRGKLWRTSLVKSRSGYVAVNQLFASSNLLLVDTAVSPEGDLVVCCHSGPPDWGNGPNGAGHIYKISAVKEPVARPVLTQAVSPDETWIAFDQPLDADAWQNAALHTRIESGRYVSAADRLEAIRPSYAVVAMQQKQLRSSHSVQSVSLSSDRTVLKIKTEPRTEAVTYAVALPNKIDVDHDLSGVSVVWQGEGTESWIGALPHLDIATSLRLARGSVLHGRLSELLHEKGSLHLSCRMDLWRMLIPAVQPRADLGYEPSGEKITVMFRSEMPFTLKSDMGQIKRHSARIAELVVDSPKENQWPLVEITAATPLSLIDVSYFTDRDPRERAFPVRRILQPFAEPARPIIDSRTIPEIAGGDYEAGHKLFVGKAACATCHQFRGEGFRVGPDINNTPHRDYAGVLRDVTNPSAVINPDAIGYTVLTVGGQVFNGVRSAESTDELQLTVAGGKTETIRRADIDQIKPMQTSLMPADVQKQLTAEELRDLMTYLLTEPNAAGK
ncbi:MAG: c-type cytochrome [Pirellulales bacterium]